MGLYVNSLPFYLRDFSVHMVPGTKPMETGRQCYSIIISVAKKKGGGKNLYYMCNAFIFQIFKGEKRDQLAVIHP